MTAKLLKIQPIILCGGTGTRLWPLSLAQKPKQFLKLTGPRTLLQATVLRVLGGEPFLDPIIVANGDHEPEIRRELDEIGAGPLPLLLEPEGRNTAPAIALAALAVPPETLLLVMPSDHYLSDEVHFRAAVSSSAILAEQGHLVTFGIAPEGPETGYGYIRLGEKLASNAYAASEFVEKPDQATALDYCRAGYLWNAGIFLFKASSYLAALEEHAPAVYAACRGAMASAENDAGAIRPNAQAFRSTQSISIDYAVLEKSDRVAVVPLVSGWSDLGTWDALYERARAQASDAEVIEIDANGCLIRSDGPTVAAIGVRDLIIVATRDAVLVVPRGQSQRVKEVIARLKGA